MSYKLLALLFCAHLTFGQTPPDFEFLYHDNQNSTLGVKHLIGDDLLFVAHNLSGDKTVIAIAKSDNTQEIIFTSNLYTKSEKVITQDSAVHFLLYNMFDYDLGIPGFYDVTYHNGEVEVKSYAGEDSSAIENEFIEKISMSISGNYLLEVQDNKLVIFDGVSILDEIEFRMAFDGIFSSQNENTYVIAKDVFFILISEMYFPEFYIEGIRDFKSIGPYNAILVKGQVNFYDENFTLVNSLNVNDEISSFNQVSYSNSKIYTILQIDDQLTISKIDWDGTNSENHDIQLNENERITSIDYLSENEFLLAGELTLNDVEDIPVIRNIFFRNVDVLNGNSYEKIDLQILDYVLTHTEKDSFVDYIDVVSNDTIWWVTYLYNVNFSLLNNSDDLIYSGSIYQTPFQNGFGPLSLKLYYVSSAIESKDQVFINYFDESFGSLDRLKNLYLFLPGANHRFNIEENIVTFPDFQSDVTDIEFNNSIKLYPNPASDFLNISSGVEIQSYAIYNSSGQLVLARKGDVVIRRIDITNLETGMYFLIHEEGVNQFVKE